MEKFPGSITYQVAGRELHVPCTIFERIVILSDAVVEILPNNPRRLSWYMCNRGASPIYFGFTTELSVSNGFFLDVNGGFAGMTVIEDGEAVGYSVYALAQSSPTIVRVLEVVAL